MVKTRLLLFNSSNRGHQFLDCESGELLEVSQLQREGLSKEDLSLLPPTVAPRGDATPIPAVASALSSEEPIPETRPEARETGRASASTRSQARKPPQDARVPAVIGGTRSQARKPLGVVSVGLGAVALVAALVWLPGRWGIPARSDWFFEDQQGGRGWLERCRRHLDQEHISVAEVACRRGLRGASEGKVRAELWLQLARSAGLRNDPTQQRRALTEAHASQPDAGIAQALAQSCSGLLLPREPGLQEGTMVVAVEGVQLRKTPESPPSGEVLARGTCLAVGPVSVRLSGEDMGLWLEVASSRGAVVERGWVREEALLPPLGAEALLARCHTYFLGGMGAQALMTCQKSIERSSDARVQSRAHQIQAVALLQKNQPAEALEHFIEAYLRASDEEKRQELGKQIEDTCAEGNRPPRASGDARVYKVVSWRGDSDKLANLRSEPSTSSSSSRILGGLARPSCVLAEPAQRIPKNNGSHELWFPVEAMVQGTPTRGWMHRVLLAP
jgi:hypothetical protein